MNLGALASLLKNNDIIMAIGIVIIVAMMIIPLPPMLLDILLTLNISLSVIILLVCLFVKEPLEYSSFPIILLVATIFRLGLNVSSTRLILLHGSAGEVINAFGQFVVGGNYIVGFIIFILLVVINFMVITGGATRVAEVSARFTLDSMPGKQLSIDADLNSGLINEDQAKARRRKLEREADFYGTMDGASKFVKGDATAGIIITVVNIFAGIVIGLWQMKMDIMTALNTFTILTVGDGLVSQLPALLISFATGLIVSRASGQEESLSDDIKKEMDDYLDTLDREAEGNNYSLIALYITDIIKNGSYVLFNRKAKDFMDNAYDKEIEEGEYLQDVVSRKKNVVPVIMSNFEK